LEGATKITNNKSIQPSVVLFIGNTIFTDFVSLQQKRIRDCTQIKT